MAASASILPFPPARRTCAVPVRVVADAENPDLLDASLTLAHTQIVAQLAVEANLDTRMMGTLGLSGALLAADIAAKDLLGSTWWTPLLAIACAALLCLSPSLGAGLGSWRTPDLGPDPFAFYSTYSDRPLMRAREQLLADLVAVFTNNALRLHASNAPCGLRSQSSLSDWSSQ